MNRSMTNLIGKALRRNNRLGLQPSWGSTLLKSILLNTSLLINSNRNYENNKKMLDNKDAGRSRSSSEKQHVKDTGN